jgi:hypothetical protein
MVPDSTYINNLGYAVHSRHVFSRLKELTKISLRITSTEESVLDQGSESGFSPERFGLIIVLSKKSGELEVAA